MKIYSLQIVVSKHITDDWFCYWFYNITDLVLKMALNTNNSILCIPNKTSGIKSLYAQISQKLKFKDFFCHRIISFTLWEGHLFLYTLFVFQW
jgi:hypothetical protein